ncbi:sigma factor-like helix-turn-helix DNA-binding protein [Streptomyces sp. DSM 42041]|uniref:Sigma factor-like helix-turn-helix DNA-binding protein n=1 Tax=Streptomyces hazeniae TaxID=3075538 RepID=A0ABU2NW33_9ACTN|nr:sigma factor-like helix-turn-helix DNA-binding protein [Streptomyces sp. DSM 42041]MDT0380944.1 sigma factor-like helix-turn-helix DNA-binding protein [Streptomyces sp. DSM 42041]
METRQVSQERRRAQEFEAFVAGAGGRLLHAATLLTAEPAEESPLAEDLLVGALARTYADWERLRGDDPYDHARLELAGRFAHNAWRYRRARGGLLGRLAPQERLILVLRLYEGVAEEQVAAALALPVERVRTLCRRATTTLRSRPPAVPEGTSRGNPPAAQSGPAREKVAP